MRGEQSKMGVVLSTQILFNDFNNVLCELCCILKRDEEEKDGIEWSRLLIENTSLTLITRALVKRPNSTLVIKRSSYTAI